MPETFWFLILVVVAGIMVVYAADRIPAPWKWLLIGIYAVIVLAWLARILGLL